MASLQILVSIFSLLFSMVLTSISAGVTVHVDHQVQDNGSESLPDELNATIVDESGTSTFLQLQRAKHIVPDIPVYTLNVDNEGKYFSRREILQKTQNVGYYQDVSAGAALQVKRMEASEGKSNQFILTGGLAIAGQNYKLEYGPSPGKREVGATPSSEYSLEPVKAISASGIDYIIPPTETQQPPVRDFLKFFHLSATGHTPSATSNHTIQRQKRWPTNVYIDLVAVADYSIYKRFRSESRPKDEDLNSLREYFSFIVNGIDVAYRSIKSSKFTFHISLARFITSETAAASSFTENYKKIYNGVEVLDSGPSLNAFSDFTTGAGRDVIFPRDHAMLFTSLGSFHDGDRNSCSGTDGYTMSPGMYPTKLNSYFFSDCSISYFEQYTSYQLSNVIGQKCLLEQLPVSPDIPDVSDRLLGQKYSVDEQCKIMKGNGSFFCRTLKPASEICLSMPCFVPDSATPICAYYVALPGTTCGNGKICWNGQCLSDPRAPAVDDDCPFGDEPGEAFNNQNCEQFINSFTGNCYHRMRREICCASCKKASRKLSGCEYGDTVPGCHQSMCNTATPEYLRNCCGTCNYGTSLPESVNTQAAAFVTESQQASTDIASRWGPKRK